MGGINRFMSSNRSARWQHRGICIVFFLSICVLILMDQGCRRYDPSDSMHCDRTNVLWLTICTLRADHLGAYGYNHNVSPFIDSLGERGVLFERTLAPAPWTRASIAAAITGLYPRTLNIEEPSARMNNRKLHDRFETIAEILKEKGYYTIGITANPNINAIFNFDQGFDYYEDTGGLLWRNGYAQRKRTAEMVNESFLKHLQSYAQDKKFFAHLTYVDVHKPLLDRVIAGRFKQLAASMKGTLTARYDMQIRYVDHEIAVLIQELESMGFKDTLIIITSDHGEAFGIFHKNDIEHGRALYNSTIWVPFILYHPSLEKVMGRRSPQIDLTCIMATTLDLLGIEPKQRREGGKSLKQLVYGEFPEPPFSFSVIETCFEDVNMSSLLESGWKLITTYELSESRESEHEVKKHELYQLEEDRNEIRDLSAEMPARVNDMFATLTQWQQIHNPMFSEEELDVEVSPNDLRDLKALGYVK